MMHATIKQFIATKLLNDPQYPIENDQSLIRGGIIDSMSLVEVGLFLEATYHIRVPDRDLTVEKMDTVDKIVAYIDQRLKK
jgi:acyl carrier protein